MRIVQIAGFLGSGKTTLLLRVSHALAEKHGMKVAMVVNEIGEIPVDGKVMEESGMKVRDIGGGCICCEVAGTFAKTIGQLYKEFGPDIVLVEPTGVAIPHQVKAAAAMGGRFAKVEIGPVIVLFDATRPDELLDMELMGRLVTSQLADATREVIPGAEFIGVSSVTGEGIDALLAYIVGDLEPAGVVAEA
jgi:G3E family GTPase